MRYNVLKFWDKFGKNYRVFLTSGIKKTLHTLDNNFPISLPPPVKMFNMHKMLFLAFKKGPIFRNTSYQIPLNQQKYATNKISHCSNWKDAPAILKALNCPLAPKEDFLGKLTNIIVTFVYQLFSIMLKCFIKKSLEQIMRYKRLHNVWSNCTQIFQVPQKMIFLGNYIQIFVM